MAGNIMQAAVVGASTLLGKELLQEISDSAAAAWDLRLLDESDEAEGQLASAGDEALVIHSLSRTSFEGIDVLFFAGAKETTLQYAEAAAQSGAAVVDLTGALAGRQGFVIRSPWIERAGRPDLTTVGVVMPHPAALMLALVVSRLHARFAVETVAATILEPASAAGAAGVDELHQQTVSLLSFQDPPKQVYGTQVAFTVLAVLADAVKTSLAENREQIGEDLVMLLGTKIAETVSIQLLQAPVFHGYVASVYLEVSEAVPLEEIRGTLHGGLIVSENDTAPGNQAASESGDLLVRVEPSRNNAKTYWLTVAADNLRLAARNAVTAALELAALRPVARVQ